ncbi:MAG TPA: TetR/AcrR family transcriptional regulator [Solirubrobacteraceae bacterium]|jgi:AcrR family transcriptional regulator|nr:TetR/AcrR family transcriptional regulator [Solirubrobacteraceae bacterium]
MSDAELPPAPRLPTRETRPARSTRERTLSRDAILDVAMGIVDAEGLDALTMRSVAHVLRTGQASLYAYVTSKEELIELLIDRVIGEIRFGGEPDPDRWQDQVKEAARQIRAVYARHGDLARASFARVPLGENALRGSEWIIGVMRAGGLPDDVVALGVDLIALYANAIAYEESIYLAEGATPEQIAAYAEEMGRYFAALPVDRFPNIVAMAGPLTAGEGDSRFEFGLEVLVRGLAAMAAG